VTEALHGLFPTPLYAMTFGAALIFVIGLVIVMTLLPELDAVRGQPVAEQWVMHSEPEPVRIAPSAEIPAAVTIPLPTSIVPALAVEPVTAGN
jgi:hypothetical protein